MVREQSGMEEKKRNEQGIDWEREEENSTNGEGTEWNRGEEKKLNGR